MSIKAAIEFPYEVYTAKHVRRESALRWKLGLREPSIWVWLIGTNPSSKSLNTGGAILRCAEELGKRLAERRYGLLTGGTYHIDDLLLTALRSYSEGLGQGSLSTMSLLKYYVSSESSVTSEDIPATIMQRKDREAMLREMMDACDVIVLISGEDGSFELANRCLEHGKPVFPIAETGGAAYRFYEALHEIPSDRMKAVYSTQLKPADFGGKYSGVISRILEFLGNRDPGVSEQNQQSA